MNSNFKLFEKNYCMNSVVVNVARMESETPKSIRLYYVCALTTMFE